MRKFCRWIKVHLQRIFMQFSSPIWFRALAQEFEALHVIPYNLIEVDGLHILILEPMIGGENYYCSKSFHSPLLQCIVDTKCVFWNYGFGWVGSIHDWKLFQLIRVGRNCIKGKFLPYKLIEDCAYPIWPWIYDPFKSYTKALKSYKTNWNFYSKFYLYICRMCFLDFEGKMEKPLWHMIDIIMTCIMLHNMCIIDKDELCIESLECFFEERMNK